MFFPTLKETFIKMCLPLGMLSTMFLTGSLEKNEMDPFIKKSEYFITDTNSPRLCLWKLDCLLPLLHLLSYSFHPELLPVKELFENLFLPSPRHLVIKNLVPDFSNEAKRYLVMWEGNISRSSPAWLSHVFFFSFNCLLEAHTVSVKALLVLLRCYIGRRSVCLSLSIIRATVRTNPGWSVWWGQSHVSCPPTGDLG